MIKERYCSREVSELLCKKGFAQGTDLRMTRHLAFYDNEGLRYDVDRWYDSMVSENVPFVVAPTHQMACDWIYENYGLYIQIFLYVTLSTNKKDNSIIKKIRWTFDIVTKFPEKGPYQYYEPIREEFASQYEATEAGLKYILKRIQNESVHRHRTKQET